MLSHVPHEPLLLVVGVEVLEMADAVAGEAGRLFELEGQVRRAVGGVDRAPPQPGRL